MVSPKSINRIDSPSSSLTLSRLARPVRNCSPFMLHSAGQWLNLISWECQSISGLCLRSQSYPIKTLAFPKPGPCKSPHGPIVIGDSGGGESPIIIGPPCEQRQALGPWIPPPWIPWTEAVQHREYRG